MRMNLALLATSVVFVVAVVTGIAKAKAKAEAKSKGIPRDSQTLLLDTICGVCEESFYQRDLENCGGCSKSSCVKYTHYNCASNWCSNCVHKDDNCISSDCDRKCCGKYNTCEHHKEC